MLCEMQAIVAETKRRLAACNLTVNSVAEGDSSEVLGPARGRRVLIGLGSEDGAMLIFSFPDKVCQALDNDFVFGGAGDESDVDVNKVLVGFCALLSEQVRAKLAPRSVRLLTTPPVVIRSSVAVVVGPQAATKTALLETSKGALGISLVMDHARVVAPEEVDTRRVLIVDDDPFAGKLLAKILGDMGLEVETVESAEQALARLEEYTPDLVMLDYQMPGMNGQQCLERIKQRDQSIAVVMVTAVGTMKVVKSCLALGASGFVVKPYQVSDVRKYVVKVLAKEPLPSA